MLLRTYSYWWPGHGFRFYVPVGGFLQFSTSFFFIAFIQIECVQYTVSLQQVETIEPEFKVKEDQQEKVTFNFKDRNV